MKNTVLGVGQAGEISSFPPPQTDRLDPPVNMYVCANAESGTLAILFDDTGQMTNFWQSMRKFTTCRFPFLRQIFE